jgi:AraC-like DNA-binding protein
MAAPATLSRQSESQQIIRNCLHRLERLLEQHQPGLFLNTLSTSGLSKKKDLLSLAEFDQLLFHVRQVIPGVTLELFSSLSLTDLGLVGYAAASADTVGDALRIANNYHALTSDRFRPVMEVTPNKAYIVPVASPAFATELQDIAEDHLAGTWNMLLQLLEDRAKPEQIRVNLAYAQPSYHSLYENIFGACVTFDTERTELVFPARWLTIPVAMANPEMAGFYSVVCERLLGSAARETDTRASVRTLLLTRQGRTMPGIDAAAAALNLSKEQFRKRLWRQGTSYKALVLEARMVLGKNYLEATSFSIQEIAYLLDYSYPGAFSRAFKMYYGIAPLSCREAALEQE